MQPAEPVESSLVRRSQGYVLPPNSTSDEGGCIVTPGLLPPGQVLVNGSDNLQPSLADCCRSCREQEDCNVWQYCAQQVLARLLRAGGRAGGQAARQHRAGYLTGSGGGGSRLHIAGKSLPCVDSKEVEEWARGSKRHQAASTGCLPSFWPGHHVCACMYSQYGGASVRCALLPVQKGCFEDFGNYSSPYMGCDLLLQTLSEPANGRPMVVVDAPAFIGGARGLG